MSIAELVVHALFGIGRLRGAGPRRGEASMYAGKQKALLVDGVVHTKARNPRGDAVTSLAERDTGPIGITLADADKIRVYADDATLSFNFFGIENDAA